MKKLIVIFTILLMITPVFAQSNIEQIKERVQSQVAGLENAMLRVRNNETVAHLEQVMNMIQERHRQRLANLTNLEFDEDENGDVFCEGKKDAKFLGIFKLKHSYKYQMESNRLQT